jgi:hypothetical protein
MLPPDLSPDVEEVIPLMLKLGIAGMDLTRPLSPVTPLGSEEEEEEEEEQEFTLTPLDESSSQAIMMSLQHHHL